MLSKSRDTRLLVAGVIAFLALIVYLAVAFANTHASNGAISATGSPFGYWVAHNSTLTRLPGSTKKRITVKVAPAGQGSYGVLVPTLVSDPTPGHRFVVTLSMRGARPGRIAVTIDEFRPDASSVYLVDTSVPATSRWRHFTFRGRVEGRWLGLGMYVSREANGHKGGKRKWFEVRDLGVALSPR